LKEEIQELQARAAELEDEVEALITGGKFSPTTKE
jgi:ribosomal protein L17